MTKKRLGISLLTVFTVLLIIPGLFFADQKEDKQQIQKNYAKAIVEAAGANITVWAYDRYLLQADWAKISTRSIYRNFKKGYIWDNNSFECNQAEHPFHGAMYHSAARVNNLSFYEGALFSLFGSMMWELGMEANRPSTNDGIFTTTGGILLGEPLFRIANHLIVDQSSQGLERVFRETLALLINPVVGIDRLITGKSFEINSFSEKHHYDLDVPVGLTSNQKLIFGISIDYKDAVLKSKPKPYDYFTFDFRAEIKQDPKIERILTKGILIGSNIANSTVKHPKLAGIFTQFDYINNVASDKASLASIGPGIVSNFDLESDYSFGLSAFISVGFGATSSSFAVEYGENFFTSHGEKHQFKRHGSLYHLGFGALGKTELSFSKENIFAAKLELSQYRISSIFIDTHERLTVISPDVSINLTQATQINLGLDHYIRRAIYKKYLIKKRGSIFRTSLLLSF